MTNWEELASIRAEWPATDADPHADLAAWREGNRVYESTDDYHSMMRAGALLCRALRHELYGPGILRMEDVPETTHRVLFSSASPPPDGRTFTEQAASQLRLGLTIVKKHRWQSREQGGDGMMAKLLEASCMVLTMAVAPSSERPWEGDLQRFFTTQPIEVLDSGEAQASAARRALRDSDRAVDSLQRSIEAAERGDPAAEARMRGTAALMRGDQVGALREFERAAQMGDVESMYDAGSAARDLGHASPSTYWFEQAAASGHPLAMYNLGAIAYNDGDGDRAARWWQQAAEAGDPSGYAALTQMADETGDDQAEFRWSSLGAEAGHPFCQLRHAQLLMRANPQDPLVITQRAIPLLKNAFEGGEANALFLIGIGYAQLNDLSSARVWLLRAEEAGDADATRVLNENGMR